VADVSVEKKGNYHNPTRQRGMVCTQLNSQKLNPSLTFRVSKSEKAQLQDSAHVGSKSAFTLPLFFSVASGIMRGLS